MYTRSDNVEIMFGDDNDYITEQLFESLLQKYEENLQNKMRGSEFEFDGVNFLYYDFSKTSINRGGSYIDLLLEIMLKLIVFLIHIMKINQLDLKHLC